MSSFHSQDYVPISLSDSPRQIPGRTRTPTEYERSMNARLMYPPPLENPTQQQQQSTRREERRIVIDTDARAAETLNPPSPETPKGPTGIEARIIELNRQLPRRIEPVPNADTLIYIDRLGLENGDAEADLALYFKQQPILVQRSKLEQLNSTHFNKKHLLPYNLERKRKALRKVVPQEILPLPYDKMYFINLTPDTEGEEALEEIQNLFCPPGVLEWRSSSFRWGNPMSLVGGFDESDGKEITDANPVEYSRIRHVKAIERFMLALQGIDPGFDSAPKVYTAVMVSKAWDIQGINPLTDWVTGWLCNEKNWKFVECLPETILKMADVLKCGAMCRDAFGILVGEAAMAYICDTTRPGLMNKNATVHGRPEGDIEEVWQGRIQHSRDLFVERINRVFEDLAGQEMAWLSRNPVIVQMRNQAISIGKLPEFEFFMDLYRRFARGSIYKILCQDYKAKGKGWEDPVKAGESLFPLNAGFITWNKLRPTERIFTRMFWFIAYRCCWSVFYSYTDTNCNLINLDLFSDGPSASCADYRFSPLTETVSLKQLSDAAAKCQPSDFCFLGEPQHIEAYSSPPKYKQSLNSRILSQLPEIPQGTPIRQKYSSTHPQCNWWNCTTYLSLPTSLTSQTCMRCKRGFCTYHLNEGLHDCLGDASKPKLMDQTAQAAQAMGKKDDASVVRDLPGQTSGMNMNVPSLYRDSPDFIQFDDEDEDFGTGIPGQVHPSISESSVGSTFNLQNVPTPASPIGYGGQKRAESTAHALGCAISDHLRFVAEDMLKGVSGGNIEDLIREDTLVQTLVCLNEEETKFLPLWADGLDDGSGGVFTNHVPASSADDAVLGPGGHRFKTRSESSEYSFASESIDSTVNTSTLGHDGYKDTLPRKQVIASNDIDTDTESEGGWSFIQDRIESRKDKQPLFTPDESEVATTLGALEDASVIDLGIRAAPTESSLEEVKHDAGSDQKQSQRYKQFASTINDESTFDDFTMDNSDSEQDFGQDSDSDSDFMTDGKEDSDLDMIQAEDLEPAVPASKRATDSQDSGDAKRTSIGSSMVDASKELQKQQEKQKQEQKEGTSDRPAWENDDSRANTVYLYKDGPEDDLLTRI